MKPVSSSRRLRSGTGKSNGSEANHLICRGLVDTGGGVPDDNAQVTVEKAT